MRIVEQIYSDIIVEFIKFERATVKEADLLKDNLTKAISTGFKKIIIDLSEVEYIDSTFLGVLVSALKRVTKEKGDIRLIGFKPAVYAMFELTRMFRVFQSYSDLHKAIKSFTE
ncbi:MAG: hypothetical protein CO129_03425 [Ignavibacteriales bacterium CG_4_9_14_3_um_filter_34_10]|nr:MAG: hypothetical protein CO129_03425 [Ignavibacteriales bacterium CG_4_9_14_3_um_filter_34_10]